MDTPLYVLSAAASMVENGRDDSDFRNRNGNPKHVGPNESEHNIQEMDHHNQEDVNKKKCAGTQTSFSSFSMSVAYNQGMQKSPENYSYKKDSVIHHNNTRTPLVGAPPPYSHYHQFLPKSAMMVPSGYQSHEMDMNTNDDAPLNLSISRQDRPGGNPINSTAPQSVTSRLPQTHNMTFSQPPPAHQPTFDSSKMDSQMRMTANHSNSSRCLSNSNCQQPDSDIHDSDIEEHFRRSLGTKYHLLESKSPSKQDKPNVSITGNVDDHFAKSLGDTWTQLNKPQTVDSDGVFMESVDDHFTKALGDTWLKLKEADTNNTRTIKTTATRHVQHSSSFHS